MNIDGLVVVSNFEIGGKNKIKKVGRKAIRRPEAKGMREARNSGVLLLQVHRGPFLFPKKLVVASFRCTKKIHPASRPTRGPARGLFPSSYKRRPSVFSWRRGAVPGRPYGAGLQGLLVPGCPPQRRRRQHYLNVSRRSIKRQLWRGDGVHVAGTNLFVGLLSRACLWGSW